MILKIYNCTTDTSFPLYPLKILSIFFNIHLCLETKCDLSKRCISQKHVLARNLRHISLLEEEYIDRFSNLLKYGLLTS